MRLRHFETFAPVCPLCRRREQGEHRLSIDRVYRGSDADIDQGMLHCSHPSCLHEYPILDGIPLLVPDLAGLLSQQQGSILERSDLPEDLRSLVGDALGPGSAYDTTRQHLSTYANAHYGDLAGVSEFVPSGLTGLLDGLLEILPAPPEGRLIDLGCSVGRNTFELAARTSGLVLGLDLSFSMLRIASRLAREGRLVHPLRRVGLVHETIDTPLDIRGRERVDFWAVDALALPLAAGCAHGVLALNLLDCVNSPLDLLRTLAQIVTPGGPVWMGSPYDWSSAVGHPSAWIGGHSQRSIDAGRSETLLRRLLTPGAHPATIDALELVGEVDRRTWTLRLHDRSRVTYDVHLVAARRRPT